MFCFDDAGELGEFQSFRKQDQPLEIEYSKLRAALHRAEADLKAHPEDKPRETMVAELKQRLKALERQAPWLNYDFPVEYLLWGSPHG
ncbi:MAG: hypothetical protein ACOZFS_04390 [Thermodesulfobacteriota bacterium]